MLRVRDLTMNYAGTDALRGVTFKLRPGEILAILGPNGCGKSTIVRLVAGLQAPTSGEIAWENEVLSSAGRVLVPPSERAVSLLLQDGVLFPHLSVKANVALGQRDRSEASVQAAMELLGIVHISEQAVTRLSGGEQQRVALARAWVQRPRMMLLDEPFHSLDATVKRAVGTELRNLVREQQIAAAFVTHDPQEAMALADRMMLLRAGVKVQEGASAEVYREPADLWVAEFLGEVESLPAARAREWGIELPRDFEGDTARFRPEDLVLEACEADAPGALTVEAWTGHGALVHVSLNLPDGRALHASVPSHVVLSTGTARAGQGGARARQAPARGRQMRILRIRRGFTTNSSGANEYLDGGKSTTPPRDSGTPRPAHSALTSVEPWGSDSGDSHSNAFMLGALAVVVAGAFAAGPLVRRLLRKSPPKETPGDHGA